MVRTQVQLSEEQLAELKRLAAESGKSVAELVRLGVQLYLSAQAQPDRREIKERAKRAVGGFNSGLPDLGRNHDDYLAEDFL